MRMNVEITIPAYEQDGKEVPIGTKKPEIIVRSHWNRTSDSVVIEIGGKTYTVLAASMIEALKRASYF